MMANILSTFEVSSKWGDYTTKFEGQNQLRGFYINVALLENYSFARSDKEDKLLPRNGDLYLFEGNVIATGYDSEALTPLGDALEASIKNTLFHFMKYGDSWRRQ